MKMEEISLFDELDLDGAEPRTEEVREVTSLDSLRGSVWTAFRCVYGYYTQPLKDWKANITKWTDKQTERFGNIRKDPEQAKEFFRRATKEELLNEVADLEKLMTAKYNYYTLPIIKKNLEEYTNEI